MAKLITMEGAEVPAVRAATTKAAGVILRELKSLQKKFPDYNFILEFDYQELAGQKHYQVRIKTMKDAK